MAEPENRKISELEEATELDGDEEMVIADNGGNARVKVETLDRRYGKMVSDALENQAASGPTSEEIENVAKTTFYSQTQKTEEK